MPAAGRSGASRADVAGEDASLAPHDRRWFAEEEALHEICAIGELGDAVAGDEERAGVLRFGLAQGGAEVGGANLHGPFSERNAGASVDELVLAPGRAQPARDAKPRPAASQPPIQRSSAPDAVREPAIEGARNE